MKNTINEYTDEQGKSPYAEWLAGLRDKKAKAKIIMQVDRMELGLFGDSQPIGDGLSELRIHSGVLRQGRAAGLLIALWWR